VVTVEIQNEIPGVYNIPFLNSSTNCTTLQNITLNFVTQNNCTTSQIAINTQIFFSLECASSDSLIQSISIGLGTGILSLALIIGIVVPLYKQYKREMQLTAYRQHAYAEFSQT